MPSGSPQKDTHSGRRLPGSRPWCESVILKIYKSRGSRYGAHMEWSTSWIGRNCSHIASEHLQYTDTSHASARKGVKRSCKQVWLMLLACTCRRAVAQCDGPSALLRQRPRPAVLLRHARLGFPRPGPAQLHQHRGRAGGLQLRQQEVSPVRRRLPQPK